MVTAQNKKQPITVPKKNAGGSISFFAYKLSLRESFVFLCRQKREQYFGN